MSVESSVLVDNITSDNQIQLTQLFCDNQASFYDYIASFTSVSSLDKVTPDKPIIYNTYNTIRYILSPSTNYAFYNTILCTDPVQQLQNTQYDARHTIQHITETARTAHTPIRIQTSSRAIDTHRILRQLRWIELPSRPDSYQYIDLYNKSFTTDLNYQSYLKSTDYVLYEINDTVQSNQHNNCNDKYQYGGILAESFGFPEQDKHKSFYRSVWSQVQCHPGAPIRMFIMRDQSSGRICGGAHLSINNGVCVIFNVVNLKQYRGNGIGQALSIHCIYIAKQMKYRYVLLQASALGAPVYKKIGFQYLPTYKNYIKLSTVALYCHLVEFILYYAGFGQFNAIMKYMNSPVRLILVPLISYVLVMYALIQMVIDSTI